MQAGKLAGITQGEWSKLECLNCDGSWAKSGSTVNAIVSTVALLLEVKESEINPPSFEKPTETPLTDLSREELVQYSGDLISDDEMSDPLYRSDFTDLASGIISVLLTLTYRERQVIMLRYGIRDGRDCTLQQIGEILGVTRERVRQTEAKAMRKLQHPTRAIRLEGFLSTYRECDRRKVSQKVSRVGQVIRSYLAKHGLTQLEFAKKTRLQPAVISRLVSRENVSPNTKTLSQLAKYWKRTTRKLRLLNSP